MKVETQSNGVIFVVRIDLKNKLDLRNVQFNHTTPSGHTDGMLYKANIIQRNSVYYIKLGQFNLSNGFYGIEPIIELVNSRIGQLLRLPVLEYRLYDQYVDIDNHVYRTLAQISKDYQIRIEASGKIVKYNKDQIEQMFNSVKHTKNLDTPLQLAQQLGLDLEIYKQFVYDYIICNMDRHGKNTEILINQSNPRDTKVAPFFDNSFAVLLQRYSSGYKNKFQFNDKMPVNNYIGYNNLLDNVLSIDKTVVVRRPRKDDRHLLFQGISSVTSRRFRDYTWEMLNDRVNSLSNIGNNYIRII